MTSLLAFAAWRTLQAIRDVDHHGKNIKGLVIRTGLLAGGIVNDALAFFTLGLLISGLNSSGISGGGQAKDFLTYRKGQVLQSVFSVGLVSNSDSPNGSVGLKILMTPTRIKLLHCNVAFYNPLPIFYSHRKH